MDGWMEGYLGRRRRRRLSGEINATKGVTGVGGGRTQFPIVSEWLHRVLFFVGNLSQFNNLGEGDELPSVLSSRQLAEHFSCESLW